MSVSTLGGVYSHLTLVPLLEAAHLGVGCGVLHPLDHLEKHQEKEHGNYQVIHRRQKQLRAWQEEVA